VTASHHSVTQPHPTRADHPGHQPPSPPPNTNKLRIPVLAGAEAGPATSTIDVALDVPDAPQRNQFFSITAAIPLASGSPPGDGPDECLGLINIDGQVAAIEQTEQSTTMPLTGRKPKRTTRLELATFGLGSLKNRSSPPL